MSREVGNVLGKELSILGFNLLLGPSLDVLEVPLGHQWRPQGAHIWGSILVVQWGEAYISGVHEEQWKDGSSSQALPGFEAPTAYRRKK
jgi:beta-N-acetylhexosaminidase